MFNLHCKRLSFGLATIDLAMSGCSGLAQGWDETKADLAAQGVIPALVYYGDVSSNLDGGAKRGSAYEGVAHIQILLDVHRLLGWPGATIFLDGIGAHGGQPDALVGDAQGVSNIGAPPGFELYEAWFQYNFAGSQYSVLAGRYDLNTEFYRLNSAGLFLNSSFGIGPEFSQSGVAGPSIYPDTSLGIRFAYKPMPNIVIRTAIFDGVPVDRPSGSPGLFAGSDGLLFVSEVAILDRPLPDTQPGTLRSQIGRASKLSTYDDKISLGGWYYTASYDDLSEVNSNGPVKHGGSSGTYILAEKLLYRSPADPTRRVSAFTQFGIANSKMNRFGSYFGLGMNFAGFIPGKPTDEVGVAVAMGSSSSHYRQAQILSGNPTKRSETAIELTYLAQISDWLVIQPDIQYVIHPDTNHLKNALVFQLRFEFSR